MVHRHKPKYMSHYQDMNTILFATDYFMTTPIVTSIMATKNTIPYTTYMNMASQAMNSTITMAQEYRLPFSYMVNSFMENMTTILSRIERTNESWILLYPATLFMMAMFIHFSYARPQPQDMENVLQDAMVTQKRYRNDDVMTMSTFGDHPMLRRSMKPRVFYMLS